MIDANPDTFAVVQYHVNDGHQTPWGDARAQFYNIWSDGVPWFAYDGLFDAWPINTYISKFQSRQAIPTPVTLSVGAANIGGDDYRITIQACLEPGNDPLDLRVYAVVVEDHNPVTPSYSRNHFRLAVDTEDIALTTDNCVVVTRDFTLDPVWVKEELKIIAWVQEPLNGIPAEVYQSAKAYWPFGPAIRIGDLNCDGEVDFGDINPFVQLLTDPAGWQAAYPDCPMLNGDINEDGEVNFGDINPFVSLLTQP